jgi:hypothetical protein
LPPASRFSRASRAASRSLSNTRDTATDTAQQKP